MKSSDRPTESYLYVLIPRILQIMAWLLLRPLLFIFADFKVSGVENLKQAPRRVIFAPNHINEIDSWVLGMGFTNPFKFAPVYYITAPLYILKSGDHGEFLSKFYTSSLSSIILKLWGAFPIKKGKKDYARSLSTHIEFLNNGHCVCIYPEGKMSKDGNIQEGHGGVIYLASATQAPIIPVAIKGTQEFSFKSLFQGKLKIEIIYGKPHLVDGNIRDMDMKSEVVEIMTRITNMLNRDDY